jgi:hypothetical protein
MRRGVSGIYELKAMEYGGLSVQSVSDGPAVYIQDILPDLMKLAGVDREWEHNYMEQCPTRI